MYLSRFICRLRLLLIAVCCVIATSAVAAPRVECDAPNYDFGTLIGQDELVHEFTVWNRGDSELVINKVRACCGMKASMGSMTIAPGSNAACRVVFDLSGRRGEQNKQVWLATNDPGHPYLDLRLTGVHKSAIDVVPSRISLGTLVKGSEAVQMLIATNLMNESVALLSVSSDVEGVRAEIIESTARSWAVRVIAMSTAVTNRLSGSVELNFSSGPIRIPIRGAVVPSIQSVPERIVFRAGLETALSRLVMLSGDTSFDIISAKLVNAKGKVDLDQLHEDHWRCSLVIEPASVGTGAFLRVQTDCADQPEIIIPLELR